MKDQSRIKLIAHRGASSEAPENTLNAMRKAVELGVDYIELDVRLTHDGVPIVIHDAAVSRTTNNKPSGYVYELTFEQIAQLDAGSWFDKRFADEKIPTLKQVLEMERNQTGVMIEVKAGLQPPEIIVDAVLGVIDESNQNTAGIVIGSFSISIVGELQKRAPHLRIMGIIEKENMVSEFIRREVKLLALWYKLVTPAFIREMHDQGIEVWTFTVDDPKTANFLKSAGIDGIITNHPRLIRELCILPGQS